MGLFPQHPHSNGANEAFLDYSALHGELTNKRVLCAPDIREPRRPRWRARLGPAVRWFPFDSGHVHNHIRKDM